jgi:hypothetical protein
VAIFIIAGVIVFLQRPVSQPGCTALSGGPPADATPGVRQLNCQ